MNALQAICERVDRGGGSEREQAAVWLLHAIFPDDFRGLCDYEKGLWLRALGDDLSDRRAAFARKNLPALKAVAEDGSAPAGARALAKGLLDALKEDQ